jgi:5-methylcytosine-specific restriction endonuclease McrA
VDTITSKLCNKCGEDKPLDAYPKHKKGKCGRYGLCRPCCAKKTQVYREQNSEKAREATRAWKKANREMVARYQAIYERANPEMVRRWRRNYRDTNRNKLIQQSLAYQKAYPDRARAKEQNRRARKRNAEGTFTPAEFAAKLELAKGRCHWCGKKIKGTPHADHVVALAKGGTNYIENIVPSCATCNKSKGIKTPLEFAGRLF